MKPVPDVYKQSGLLNEAYPLPYFFDVVHYEALENRDLAEHIERVGEIIFAQERINEN